MGFVETSHTLQCQQGHGDERGCWGGCDIEITNYLATSHFFITRIYRDTHFGPADFYHIPRPKIG
jgi:hypothetical protein